MKTKTIKNNLKLEKITISRITNLNNIIGGTGPNDDGTDGRTNGDECKRKSLIIK